jgi:hypothetical protein
VHTRVLRSGACGARQKKKMRGGIPDEEILSVEVGLERAHARQDLSVH